MGPFTISLIQMLVVALGVGLALAMWNGLVKNGSDKIIAALLCAPVAIIAVVIAFFKVSELPLIPLVGKMIQTYIIDEPQKYQIMLNKNDTVGIHLKQLSKLDPDHPLTQPKTSIDLDKREQIEKKDIL